MQFVWATREWNNLRNCSANDGLSTVQLSGINRQAPPHKLLFQQHPPHTHPLSNLVASSTQVPLVDKGVTDQILKPSYSTLFGSVHFLQLFRVNLSANSHKEGHFCLSCTCGFPLHTPVSSQSRCADAQMDGCLWLFLLLPKYDYPALAAVRKEIKTVSLKKTEQKNCEQHKSFQTCVSVSARIWGGAATGHFCPFLIVIILKVEWA